MTRVALESRTSSETSLGASSPSPTTAALGIALVGFLLSIPGGVLADETLRERAAHVERSAAGMTPPGSIHIEPVTVPDRTTAAFVENRGQVDERVAFYLRSGLQTLWVTREGLVFDLLRLGPLPASAPAASRGPPTLRDRLVFSQQFVDAEPGAMFEPQRLQDGLHNYLLGSDPSRWRTGVSSWSEIRHREVWRGIDVRLHRNGRHLEQEFVVRPGGDPRRIQIAYRGIDGLRVADDGSLVIRTAFGELRESPPTVYQEIDGRRVAVTAGFQLLSDTTYTFELGRYQRQFALVIDPTIVYATYLGGTANEDAGGQMIAVDAASNVYVGGSTASLDFPATVGQTTYGGGTGLLGNLPAGDVFVAKFNAAGTALVYATYIGGSGEDAASGIAVDAAGNLYVTGVSTSPNYPTANAFQANRKTTLPQAFVTKLNATGNALVYSTYLGSSAGETGGGIAVDATGNAYVTGLTGASDFPTVNSIQPFAGSGGAGDAFITKLAPAGNTLVYSTFLGGTASEQGKAIAVDSVGNAYVAGYTNSTDFPTTNGAQPLFGGSNGQLAAGDGFVAKLNAAGSAFVYVTYLGGSGDDQASGIAVDPDGNAYVTGTTTSSNFPTLVPYQGSLHGTSDAFVTKLDATGALVYSTYLGGGASEFGNSIGVDEFGQAYVTGMNTSSDFPLQDAFLAVQGAGVIGFVTALVPDGTHLVYSSLLGGVGRGIAVDPAGNAYVVGMTSQPTNIPTTLFTLAGGQDAFVMKIAAPRSDLSVSMVGSANPVASGSNLSYTIRVRNPGPDPAVDVVLIDPVPAGTTFQSFSPATGCTTPAVNAGTGSVSCALGTMGIGGELVFTLTVRVTALSGTVTNTATITTSSIDTNAANDSDTVVTSVVPSGIVTGRVTQADGVTPIAAATVSFYDTAGFRLATTTTAADGTYSAALAAANYKISAEANNFALAFWNGRANLSVGDVVSVTANQTTSNINFTLAGNSGGIGGRVTRSTDGQPVGNATIVIKSPNNDNFLVTSTDAGGNYYTQRRLAAGTYLVRVNAAGFATRFFQAGAAIATATPIVVTANADALNRDVVLVPGVGGISGRVIGLPLGAAASISIFEGATNSFVQGFNPDAAGNYDTGLSLGPGVYKVQVSGVPGFATAAYNNRQSVAFGDPVTVNAGLMTPNIDITLQALGGITGHVRNAANNAPLAGAIVDVYDFAGNGFVVNTTTAADGSYTITGLNPLQGYRVRARLANFGFVFFDGKVSAGSADLVLVPSGTNATLDFLLGGGGGILGTVRDATSGLPISGVSVDVIDGAATNFSINNFDNFAVTTDASGNFNTGRVLAPGVYKLRARKVNSGYSHAFFPNARDQHTGLTVTVTAGADTSGTDIVMSLGATITGTIRDRASGTPLSGATVIARRVAASAFSGDFTVTTNASGVYSISGLHPGDWLLSAQAAGRVLAWYSGDANNTATDYSSSTPVTITGTETISNANMNLAIGGAQLQGRITRSDNGQSVRAGTQVNIRGPWPRTTAVSPAAVLTNAQGEYSVTGLAPGRYIIEADRVQVANGTAIGFAPLGAVSRPSGVPVTVAAGSVVTQDFQVLGFGGGTQPRAIRGTLRRPGGQPITDAFIFAIEPTATGLVRVVSAFDDGSFVMDGLSPGRYLINANTEKTFVSTQYPGELTLNTASLVDVTAGDVSGVDLVLSDDAGTVTGTITRSDNGQPVPGASVSVRTFLDASVVGATTRVDGTYLVRGVEAGQYKVRVSAPGFVTKFFTVGVPAGVRTLEAGSFISVNAGAPTANINVVLDPTAGALTGIVRRQDTLQPVVATVVAIHDAATGDRVIAVSTDASGTWRTEGLGPGNYKVSVLDVQASRHAARWYNGEGTLLDADVVSVGASGVTGGIDVLVSPNHGSVAGRVFESNGTTPLPDAVVEILDAATGGLVRRALTGSDGTYLAQGLAPGGGQYVARLRALGHADQFWSNTSIRASATPLTVTNGGTTPNVNFAATRSSDATGRISYGGSQTGALVVRLFAGPGFTQLAYEAVVPTPSFAAGQLYGFRLAAPDTRGLLPGSYQIRAFLDSNGNRFQDATEAAGSFVSTIVLAENQILTGVDFGLTDPAATTNTPPVADPQLVLAIQGTSRSIILTGLDVQTATANLAYSVVTSPTHGTLGTTLNPQERVYTPTAGFFGTDSFSFTVTDRGDPDNCGAPGPACAARLTSAPATVTIQVAPNAGTTSQALANPTIPAPATSVVIGNIQIVENATGALFAGGANRVRVTLPTGLTFQGTPVVSLSVANGAVLNPPIIEAPGVLAFTLAAPSSAGPATILVSGMAIVVPSGYLESDVTSAGLLTTISGPNPGLTAAIVQNATIVSAAAGPSVSGVAPTTAAVGAQARVLTLAGANFDPDATVQFGPGVTTTTVVVDSPTQIRATVNVAASAPLGLRDVTVTNVGAGQSATRVGALEITPRPTITSVSGPLVHCNNQLVSIGGTNFAPPTTAAPSDLLVAFSGSGIVVTDVGFTSSTTITAIVNVAADAAAAAYDVTVTNPDAGVATRAGAVAVVASACEAAPPSKSQPTVPPAPPAITSLSATSGPVGSTLSINGTGLSPSPVVTFAGPNGTRLPATIGTTTATAVTVTVPATATSGNVTVSVNSLLSNATPFAVTTPVLSGVVPGIITTNPATVSQVVLTLTGSRFVQGARVTFAGPAGDVTLVGSPIVSADGTIITQTVSVPPTPQLTGGRDVTVINPGTCSAPLPATCLSSTLASGLQLQVPVSASLMLTLPDFADISTYLPSVTQVSLSRLATGACNPATKVVTPASVRLQARFATTTGLTPPASVTFTLTSSALPGTASNEDCEVDPANPTKDFSIGTAVPTSQQVVVADGGGGIYQTTLFSHDWGGKVTIAVSGTTGQTTVTGTLALPVDSDGDDLPDAYEKNTALNADATGANVLNSLNPDQNGNGVKDRDDRFARDGLSNFEKYRGVYLAGPAPNAAGAFGSFQRLGAGLRHLFVRGRGFRDDPAVPAGFCGIDPVTGAPVADPALSSTNRCPTLQVGAAFQGAGIAVHNVTASFTQGSELPRVSLVNPLKPTLDLATVVYDAVGCKGTEACDTTSKFGVRQWGYNTLGYTTPIGTATTYGVTSIFKRAIESYFNNRPYQHRVNDPARTVIAPDGTAMLAPITRVGDSGGTGADNGRVDTGDGTVNGELAGDTYVAGSFSQQLSAFDVNNDGCTEAPTAADPTTLVRCDPTADTAPAPSATKQQVARSVITHELGHVVGAGHTSDPTDIMYLSTINFSRDDHFSSAAAALLQIHNKGLQ